MSTGRSCRCAKPRSLSRIGVIAVQTSRTTSSASISAPSSGSKTICIVFAPRWTSCVSSRERATMRLPGYSLILFAAPDFAKPTSQWTACVDARPPAPHTIRLTAAAILSACHAVGLGLLARATGARRACDNSRDAPHSCRIGRPDGEEFPLGRPDGANFEAHDQGAETAILLDLAGFVTEGPGFNVFTVIDGVVASPHRGALEGITRLLVFELCEALGIPTQTRSISGAEIEGADEIFFSTTAGGIMPVSRLGSRILGNDRPGPISSRLRKAYWDKRREGWHATPMTTIEKRTRRDAGARLRTAASSPFDRRSRVRTPGCRSANR